MSERPVLSTREIGARARELEAGGYPPDETGRFAEQLAHHCWGPAAEEALARALEALSRDRLELLVGRHVMNVPDSAERPSYCGEGVAGLVARLEALGFGVERGDGAWSITMPGGEEISGGYGSGAGGLAGAAGDAICRLGLLAVWTRTMRLRETR